MIKLLIVDDQPGVLAGLQMQFALEADIEVVGEAQDGAEAIVQAQRLHPDVIVMDARMPIMDGIAATEILRRLEPQCCVVILSLHDDKAMRTQARSAGAVAFVAKHESSDKLFAAVRQAAGFFSEY